MRLVIAEKPSVARDLGKVLGAAHRREGWLEGDDVCITWCVGHLVELEEPSHYGSQWRRWSLDSLPVVPESFELRIRKDAADQFEVIKRLLLSSRFSTVINACDAGREGELIFDYVFRLAGGTQPTQRLWLPSLTEVAIRRAWAELRPGEQYRPLLEAALCRSEADWLVGMNATRGMTCLARASGTESVVLSVGRVQTPTLAMIVRRDMAISEFIPEPIYQVKAQVTTEAGASWSAFWFDAVAKDTKSTGDEAPRPERLPSRELAEALVSAVNHQVGTVQSAERVRSNERPPLLYDLTSLQRRANQRYGLSAQRTLDIAQSLYERHKLITYPRTDSRHLTPDQVPEFGSLLRGLREMSVYREPAEHGLQRLEDGLRLGRRFVDAGEVGDHHAILPTGRPAHTLALSPDEKRVFDLVARRFLAALAEDAHFEKTTLIVSVDVAVPEGLSRPAQFRARGRVCTQLGWRAVDPPKKRTDRDLPLVEEGAEVRLSAVEVAESETRPPRRYDDASILLSMERAGKDLDDAELRRAMRAGGLGTPATRAAVLQTLLSRGFVRRDGRSLIATERGTALIASIPSAELTEPVLTGRWEKRLADIADGTDSRDAFMRDVRTHVDQIVSQMVAAGSVEHAAFAAPKQEAAPVGPCRRCGGVVSETRAVYRCDGCEFLVFKTMSGREISRRMVVSLLREGRTAVVKGFKSQRTGRKFAAGLTMADDGSVQLWFPEPEVVGPCPHCEGGQIVAKPKAFACTTEGCGAVVFQTMSGREIQAAEVRALIEHGKTEELSGFTSRRTGKTFSARLAWDEQRRATFLFSDVPRPAVGERSGPISTGSPNDPAGTSCPTCREGTVLRGRTAWGCSRWREGCEWRKPYPQSV